MIVTKPLDLSLLQQELAAAGIAVTGLGTYSTPEGTVLHTYDAQGMPADLPPAAGPVVDAHVAPPRTIDFAASQQIDAVMRTTDGQPHELLRFPLAAMTGYDCELKVMGVDAGNGAVKKLKVDATIKRLAGGPVAVSTPTTTVTHQDAAASGWAVALTFSGNDALVSVTGTAGRSVDWVCRAAVGRFAPGGLTA